MTDNYLEHYGVKGQKWGVRRYQNEDGSLTAEGRAKYGVSGEARGILGGGARGDSRSRTASTLNRKPKKMTSKQLEARKTKTKKILAAAGGVTLAAAIGLGIGLYAHSKKSSPTSVATNYKGLPAARSTYQRNPRLNGYMNSVKRLPARAAVTLNSDEFRIR